MADADTIEIGRTPLVATGRHSDGERPSIDPGQWPPKKTAILLPGRDSFVE